MRNIIVILFLTFTINLFGQSHSEAITKRFETYSAHLESKEIDKMIAFIYPKIFDVFPKAGMAEGIKEMMFDEEMKVNISNSKLVKLSDTQYFDDVNYAILLYSNKTEMQFPKEEGMNEYVDMMINNFILTHGSDNVNYDESSNTITINAQSKIIAVNNPEFGDWFFIEDNPQLYVYDFVPEGVLEYMVEF